MPYILKKYYPLRNILFFLGEGALIFLAIAAVYYSELGFTTFFSVTPLFLGRALVVTFVFQLCLYYFDLYDLSIIPSFSENAARITQAFGFGCIALGLVYFFFPIIIISTKIFWTSYFAICLIVSLWRFVYFRILERRMFTQSIVLIGTGNLAADIAEAIENKKDSGYKIQAYIGEDCPKVNPHNVPCFQDNKKLLELAYLQEIEKIVLALDERRGNVPAHELIACKLMGIKIVDGVGFYEELTGKVLVEKVNPSWILFSEGFRVGRFAKMSKRLIDIAVSTAGLVVSLPITLLSALIIKLETPGPVFYAQERVGEKGDVFRVLKFRSMRSDAEKDGPVWAKTDDDRVTRYGKIIRKIRIDEIPQMINVLKGDMSFVGPRPERPIFVNELEKKIPYYSMRHTVKPGITGWAQVFYPYGASEEDALRKLEFDLYYIKNLTLRMDLWVIFQTVKIVLFQKGAR
jgi:sugar transferase (PEP-CTERM system associated)